MFTSWSTTSIATADRPSHHTNNRGTAFKNPWPSAEAPTWGELFQTKSPLGWYDDLAKTHPRKEDVKVVAPDWGVSNLKARGLTKDKCIVGTSLGHAGAIIELPIEGTAEKGEEKKSFWIVYDPMFSWRAGPTQYTGPRRMKSAPCQITDLPGTGISHSLRFLLTDFRL